MTKTNPIPASKETPSIQITEGMVSAGVAANVDFGDRSPWEAREFAKAVYVAMETERRRASPADNGGATPQGGANGSTRPPGT